MLCHILVLPCVTLACLVQHVECFQLQLIALFKFKCWKLLEPVISVIFVFTARWAQRQAKDSEFISERVYLRGADSLALLARAQLFYECKGCWTRRRWQLPEASPHSTYRKNSTGASLKNAFFVALCHMPFCAHSQISFGSCSLSLMNLDVPPPKAPSRQCSEDGMCSSPNHKHP